MLLDTKKMNPAIPMTDAEVFNAAADYMERYGHCKGAFAKDGAVCMWGALGAVITGDPYGGNRVPFRLIDKLEGMVGLPLVIWNDLESTKSKAVALLRRAAQT